MPICSLCKEAKTNKEFKLRTDRLNSFYAWCNTCRVKEHRTEDYPPPETQGGGNLHPIIPE